MESRLGKVLSYVGTFFIGTGIFVGIIFISIFWLGASVMLSGVSLGLIMLGLAKVIAQQEEILKRGTGSSNPARIDGNGISKIEG
jgi:hypothetical protein